MNPSEYINESISVTDEDIQEAEKIQDDPEKMLQLINMMYLFSDQERILS